MEFLRIFFIGLFMVCFQFTEAQIKTPHTFGKPLPTEFELKDYKNDPDAAGVVLYERGNYSMEGIDGYIRLVKHIHRKIKVLDAANFDKNSFEIPYYHDKQTRENVRDFAAITHNGSSKKHVESSAIFDTKENENWSVKKFTFPDVQDGSILEYTYQIETPFLSNFGNWEFGKDIPTLYSELHMVIPGNYIYNGTLRGNKKLEANQQDIRRGCFQPDGFKTASDCAVSTYVMTNIPAYEEESFMLSMDNYLPAIHFELVESNYRAHDTNVYSETWEDVDKRLRVSKSFGKQLKLSKFFKKELPDQLFKSNDPLEKAKSIYDHIQNHFTWDGKLRVLSEIDVKRAYVQQKGNASEINFALFNSLEAAGIKAEILLLSTRNNAMISKKHPTLRSFNYTIVRVEIDQKTYLLDATDKFAPFGVLPMRALNMEGRIYSEKNDSRWEEIKASENNNHFMEINLSADENGIFQGNVKETSTGYFSYFKHQENAHKSIQQIIEAKQNEHANLTIDNFQIENRQDLNQAYTEIYHIEIEHQQVGDRSFLYPFMIETYFTENPFKTTQRSFPIETGFTMNNNFVISIDLKDQYEVVKLPKNQTVIFDDKSAALNLAYEVIDSKISIRMNLKILKTFYPARAADGFHQLFSTWIDFQKNQPIELKKI